ncbi:TldD/PmbA family protein [Trichocoleus desertorum AS-A10]|uniref:TldD/PmbA family protein n=1 Tax=Trichocoleus desertorum TaxID=1481672 RepID=UPI0032996FA6
MSSSISSSVISPRSSAELTALESSFAQVVEALLRQAESGEFLTIKLSSERSQFVRFNQAKVRQIGNVADGSLKLTLIRDQRTSYRTFPLTGDLEVDLQQAQLALADLRQAVPQLPIDPYLVIPAGTSTSHDVHLGQLLAPEAVTSTVLPIVAELDFAGLYAAGLLVRGYADSSGQKHWFATDSFALDYSLFGTGGEAAKGTLAGSTWDTEAYKTQIEESKAQLQLLSTSPKQLSRGQYRTYFAPAAIAELVGMLSWGGISEAALQQGNSALKELRRGQKRLSPRFTLKENFQHGLVPRFNEWGETAPIELPLIVAGELVNTLVSDRTAKEYGLAANGAGGSEGLRSPEISAGGLAREQILAELGTGLYVSNLHYLNWSDRPTGRITGMTRYACFWVENGEIVAPIENLRFDESLYRFWGENLIDCTNFQEFIPEVGTYGGRQLGGCWVPGMLVEGFTYTL